MSDAQALVSGGCTLRSRADTLVSGPHVSHACEYFFFFLALTRSLFHHVSFGVPQISVFAATNCQRRTVFNSSLLSSSVGDACLPACLPAPLCSSCPPSRVIHMKLHVP